MLSKTWERYIFFQAVKFILFFLFCIYSIYVLIDFSTHSARLFTYSKFATIDLFFYYIHHFIMRLHLFLPLALLFALLKVLGSMNLHNEIVSLRMAGISVPMLSRPFFIISLFIALSCYANFQFFAPSSFNFVTHFKELHLRKPKENTSPSLHILPVKKGTKLIYQSHNLEENTLYDVFWIVSPKELWHIKQLFLQKPYPIGHYADQLVYDQKGQFSKKASYETYTFHKIKIRPQKKETSIPFENYSIGSLFSAWRKKQFSSMTEKSDLLTQLHYKLAMPFFSFIIVLALTPYCIIFSRNFRFLITIILSLCGYVIFFTFMDAAVILGEHNVVPPFIALWAPIILGLYLAGHNFYKRSQLQ